MERICCRCLEHLAGFHIQHNLRLENEILMKNSTIAHNDVTSGSYRLKIVPGTDYMLDTSHHK